MWALNKYKNISHSNPSFGEINKKYDLEDTPKKK